MPSAILYSTEGCHLCEQAMSLLAPLTAAGQLAVTEIDIAYDDALLERYGARIPVLHLVDSDQELGWPFDEDALRRFLPCV